MNRGALLSCGIGVCVLASIGFRPGPARPVEAGVSEQAIVFNRDVLPILSDNCFTCHGPDSATRVADLRLDTRDGAMSERDAGSIIVPGDPDASLLIQRVATHDELDVMPPPETGKSLTPDQIDVLRRWIDQGAAWGTHWAFTPAVRPTVPSDAGWGHNQIDRFVKRKLDEAGLEPSPEADLTALFRRVCFDLTGLPPTIEQLDELLADSSPNAFEHAIDRLLDSPAYGERMTMAWLDVARYADTHGYHHDDVRVMWPWRDWVIRSFNTNKPYDEFIVEQLAGDLLEGPSVDQRIATGFGRNHPITFEGGVISEEYRVEYVADRVTTTATALMGLTMDCARCHEHKYDPISQDEYYQFYAFFNSVAERGLDTRAATTNPMMPAPTPDQRALLVELERRVEAARAMLDQPIPGLEEQQLAWENALRSRHTVEWVEPQVVRATSRDGATLTILDDSSIRAEGENPAKDQHTVTYRTDRTGLRVMRLDVLRDEHLPEGGPGRAPNGNAVLSSVRVDAVSIADPSKRQTVHFDYAWADHEQPNGDFDVYNLVSPDRPGEGWAIDGHNRRTDRVAVFVAREAFGFEGGTELTVSLGYDSVYSQHVFGRVRVAFSPGTELRDLFPMVTRDWWQIRGGLVAETADAAFDRDFGPEAAVHVHHRATYEGQGWEHRPTLLDGDVLALSGTQSAFYFGRTIFTPRPVSFDVSLGSDDAIKVLVNGVTVHSNNTRRGVAPDQDQATISLEPGENTVLVKIVNDGGPGGFYWRPITSETGSEHSVAPLALLPVSRRSDEQNEMLRHTYRESQSPVYRERRMAHNEVVSERDTLNAEIPTTMVMADLEEPRQTYVLIRGAYDNPDMDRPVTPDVPAALGAMPTDAPANRLGLAQWLVAPDHPLTARVAVNRLWQLMFGTGLVATSEDFGSRAEWPSHPELLDWLAVEFVESGWDVKAMLRLIVSSATYRQSSRVTPELLERDPENRLLARGPRQRLDAEMIRDQALAISGLLVEQLGGPSVRPYQPAGLWRERAIPGSNTTNFERDEGEALYRRSMYTFWKRSAPPPQMATFDAPEREVCTVRRASTNTPLQALVLMNDETYVEASRVLAERMLIERETPAERVDFVFRLATGRTPDEPERAALLELLHHALARYEGAPEEAGSILDYGEAPAAMDLSPVDVAAHAMVASVVLNLDESITRR